MIAPAQESPEQMDGSAMAGTSGGVTQIALDAELSVELLRGRRAVPISAAVTGKIDVRRRVEQPEAAAA